jgi:hypothetical protein
MIFGVSLNDINESPNIEVQDSKDSVTYIEKKTGKKVTINKVSTTLNINCD